MTSSYDIFKKILEDTNNTRVIYTHLKEVIRPPYDYTDLLRWQWAQAVSSLDKLVHDLVRVGMLEIFIGRRPTTSKFMTFTIGIDSHLQIIQNSTNAVSIIEKLIIQKHGFLSFQDPDKISEALSYIWDEKHKWQKIAQRLNLDESYVKTQLKNISIRRNQIVHEGDYSSNLLDRQPLSENDVNEVLFFIDSLGLAIYELVKI